MTDLPTWADLTDAADARGLATGIEAGVFYVDLPGGRMTNADLDVLMAAVAAEDVAPPAPSPDMAAPEDLGEAVTAGDDGFESEPWVAAGRPAADED